MSLLISPVTDCSESEALDIGAALFVFTPACPDSLDKPFCITCADQRNDSTLSFAQASIEVPNQCSTVTTMRPSGLTITATISLGLGINRPELQAALFNVPLAADGASEDCSFIEYESKPKSYKHWQVAIIPYDGITPSEEYGYVLYYAVVMPESSSLTFGPSGPREMSITVKAEPHPQTQKLGRSMFGCGDQLRQLAMCAV